LPALTSNVKSPQFGNYNGGIFFTLLPFLEQVPLFNAALAADKTNTWDAKANDIPLRAYSIKVYLCPSDLSYSGGVWNQWKVDSWTGGSYAANYQVFGGTGDVDKGYFPVFRGLGNIPDGTSNTIGLGEAYASCNNQGQPTTKVGNLWAYPGIAWGWEWTPVFANSKVDVVGGGKASGGGFATGKGAAGAYWDARPQNTPSVDNCLKANSQAIHHGLMVTGLLDGSVRTINQSLTYNTWVNALLPADGNPLGADWNN
jgi:hypothetical protein